MKSYELLAERSKKNREIDTRVTEILSEYNLTPSDWTILGFIHDHEVNVTSIARQMSSSMAFVTNRVNELEKLGWVEREVVSGADQRVRKLTFCGDEATYQHIEEAISNVL